MKIFDKFTDWVCDFGLVILLFTIGVIGVAEELLIERITDKDWLNCRAKDWKRSKR